MLTAVHGETHILAHCVFRWEEVSGQRIYLIEPDHCDTCLQELRRVAPRASLLPLAKLATSIRRP